GANRELPWAASEHDLAGTAAQRRPARRTVSSRAGAGARGGATKTQPAAEAVRREATGAGRSAAARRVEPRTGDRIPWAPGRTEDQPRDDLPARLGGPPARGHAAPAPARRAQELPETLSRP